MIEEHDTGRVNHGLRLWNLLWLELWHQTFIDAPTSTADVTSVVATGTSGVAAGRRRRRGRRDRTPNARPAFGDRDRARPARPLSGALRLGRLLG